MMIVEANGAEIPVIGLGTWRLEGDACVEAVREALRAGYRHIDTAQMYENEEAVGEGIRQSGVPREEIFLTTKIWWTHLAEHSIQRAAEASLKKLGVDHVDLLLVHWPNPKIRLAETMRGLGDVMKYTLAHHIGVSNFPVDLMIEAAARAGEPLAVNQCEYHPYLNQRPLIEACQEENIAFTAYCPLGRGEVLGEAVVKAAAEAHGKSPAQIVLRWHVQQGTVAIPKSSHIDRIRENIDIFDFELSDAEMAAISGLARPNGRMVDPEWAPDWDEWDDAA